LSSIGSIHKGEEIVVKANIATVRKQAPSFKGKAWWNKEIKDLSLE